MIVKYFLSKKLSYHGLFFLLTVNVNKLLGYIDLFDVCFCVFVNFWFYYCGLRFVHKWKQIYTFLNNTYLYLYKRYK